MVFVDVKALRQMFQDVTSMNEIAATRAYEKIVKIPHLETRVDAITYAARNTSWENIAKKAFSDLCSQMSSSREYTPQQEAGQMEEMVYYGCKVPSIRVSAIEHILGLIESGKIEKDIDPTRKFLDFVLEKTKNKESPTVLRAKLIRGLE
jgi:hypothetical protein